MSKTSIDPIGSVLPSQSSSQLETVSTPKPGAPPRAKPAAQVQAEPKPANVDEKSTLPVSNGSNISIHFRVDDETNELTVFVIDRQSRRVLRSIPASELEKLQAGDVLKLTA